MKSNERGAQTTKTISELRQICSRLAAGGSRRAKLLGAWIEGEVNNARLEALLEDGAEAPEEKPKKGGKAKAKAKAKKDEPATDTKTGARLPPMAKKSTKPRKPAKASPVADAIDPDEDPQLGASPQDEAEMSAEEADKLLNERDDVDSDGADGA